MDATAKTNWLNRTPEQKAKSMEIWLSKDVVGFSPARKHLRRECGAVELPYQMTVDNYVAMADTEEEKATVVLLARCFDAMVNAGYEPHTLAKDPAAFCELVIRAAQEA